MSQEAGLGQEVACGKARITRRFLEVCRASRASLTAKERSPAAVTCEIKAAHWLGVRRGWQRRSTREPIVPMSSAEADPRHVRHHCVWSLASFILKTGRKSRITSLHFDKRTVTHHRENDKTNILCTNSGDCRVQLRPARTELA